MVTITLDKLSPQSVVKDLHFSDLSSFLEFLKENDYITQVGRDDDARSSEAWVDAQEILSYIKSIDG